MRVFYGYNRRDVDAKKRNCPRVFLDTKATHRSERGDMIHQLLRSGDELVVVSERDLGRGRELQHIKGLIEMMGVTLIAEPDDKPKEKATTRGATPEHKAIQGQYWHKVGYSIDYINDRFEDAELPRLTRNQMRYAMGERGTQ